jgi:hypothetical protein
MPGAWLIWVAQRLLHDDTFHLVASPAIADLQYEAGTAPRGAVTRAYVGAWSALAGAMCRDAAADARLLVDDAGILTAITGIQVCYFGCMTMIVAGGLSRSQSLALLMGVLTLSAACTALCFWPERRRADADNVGADPSHALE